MKDTLRLCNDLPLMSTSFLQFCKKDSNPKLYNSEPKLFASPTTELLNIRNKSL